jgi:hypothetical protein
MDLNLEALNAVNRVQTLVELRAARALIELRCGVRGARWNVDSMYYGMIGNTTMHLKRAVQDALQTAIDKAIIAEINKLLGRLYEAREKKTFLRN